MEKTKRKRYLLSKADLSLVELIINDFVHQKNDTKSMLTDEGFIRLVEINWIIANHNLPLIVLDKKIIKEQANELLAEFRKTNKGPDATEPKNEPV